MSDALRAARIVPAFRNALDVRLVETSPALAAMQHELLVDSGVAVSWAQTLRDVPDGPAIVIGNEFLDALPVRQFVRVKGQWRERMVRGAAWRWAAVGKTLRYFSYSGAA